MCEDCMNCGKPITTNIQRLWVKWKNYGDPEGGACEPEILDGDPPCGENLFFCDECTKLWEEGEIDC